MFRVPLWDTYRCTSHSIGEHSASNIRLMNTYEIIGGKITALLARAAARDLFDVYHLFSHLELEKDKLRLACILYGTISTVDWRAASLDKLDWNADEIKRLLIPLLKQEQPSIHQWTQGVDSALKTCKQGFLNYLLPLTGNEIEFLNCVYDKGIIEPALLTNHPEMIEKIPLLPGLKWKLQTNKQGSDHHA